MRGTEVPIPPGGMLVPLLRAFTSACLSKSATTPSAIAFSISAGVIVGVDVSVTGVAVSGVAVAVLFLVLAMILSISHITMLRWVI